MEAALGSFSPGSSSQGSPSPRGGGGGGGGGWEGGASGGEPFDSTNFNVRAALPAAARVLRGCCAKAAAPSLPLLPCPGCLACLAFLLSFSRCRASHARYAPLAHATPLLCLGPRL